LIKTNKQANKQDTMSTSVMAMEVVDEPPSNDNGGQPQLWSTKCHFRLTRRGKLFKTVQEHYLRDDLGLGSFMSAPTLDSSGRVAVGENNVNTAESTQINSAQELRSVLVHPKQQDGNINSSPAKTTLLVCDTNVLLHNLDVLEHSLAPRALTNIVIPQTCLEECRNNSLSHYNRVMEFLKSNGGSAGSGNNNNSKNHPNNRCVIFFPDTHHMETQVSAQDRVELETNKAQLETKHKNKDDNTITVTENDRNDLRIRHVASYFGSQLASASDDDDQGDDVQVILLSDDRQCRQLANLEQPGDSSVYTAQSVREHVKYLTQQDPSLVGLMDVVAQQHAATNNNSSKNKASDALFDRHLSSTDISRGVKSMSLYQGTIRSADRNSFDKCYVTIRKGDDRVAVNVTGSKDINRAVDGDLVAIQLHPIDQWITESDKQSSGSNKGSSSSSRDKNNAAGVAMETAEPSIRDADNVKDEVKMQSRSVKPTGKVVGVVKRNFRQNFCGSIFSTATAAKTTADTDEAAAAASSKPASESEAQRQRRAIAVQCEMEHADGTHTCVFFAVDQRVAPILIRTSQRDFLLGKRLLVSIDSWPLDSPYPLGHYVRSIGEAGDKDVETEVVLHEHNIPCEPFSAQVSNNIVVSCSGRCSMLVALFNFGQMKY
jgi:exosome complex exonuclease DIS3/RRP44